MVNLFIKFTYKILMNVIPIFVRGYLEFIFDLVYLPVNITITVIWPAARTVLAHAVLSKFNDYFFPF